MVLSCQFRNDADDLDSVESIFFNPNKQNTQENGQYQQQNKRDKMEPSHLQTWINFNPRMDK